MPRDPAHRHALVALGSNLGDRLAQLRQAVDALDSAKDIAIVAQSRIYETAPIGGPMQQPRFLNAAVALSTTLTAADILACCLAIEDAMGRQRKEPNGPRCIDLDLLAFDNQIVRTADLDLPHPRLAERRFVLTPLADIAADWRHPVLHQSVTEMLRNLGPAAADDAVQPTADPLRL